MLAIGGNFWESKRNVCFIIITGEWNKALWSWRTLCCLRVHKIRVLTLFFNKLSTGLALSKSLHSLKASEFSFSIFKNWGGKLVIAWELSVLIVYDLNINREEEEKLFLETIIIIIIFTLLTHKWFLTNITI